MVKNTLESHDTQLEEALRLLNDAARDKKEEVKRLIEEKYAGVRIALTDAAIGNREILKQMRHNAEERVRSAPWPTLGFVAAGAAVLGFILGASRRY